MRLFYLIIFCFCINQGFGQKTIHVFVALCDNVNQGIVPVPEKIGNGQDPYNNLYWGAYYGVKTHFKKSKEWTLLKVYKNPKEYVLERVLFKHNTTGTYLLADAYDGKYIKDCITDFFRSSCGDLPVKIVNKQNELKFGGDSQLLAYVGHDGLMEFDIDKELVVKDSKKRDAIMLACISKEFFKPYIEKTKTYPLVWTTGLMAPEAYTLKWAIDGWLLNESNEQIRERAAQAYNKYQKCGIRGARRLLVTGY